MSLSFSQQANSGICDLKPYQPGKPTEELQRELNITEIVKLASNENPLVKIYSIYMGELLNGTTKEKLSWILTTNQQQNYILIPGFGGYGFGEK